MKTKLLASLLLTFPMLTQAADLTALEDLMQKNQSLLEKSYPGQSRKTTNVSIFSENSAECERTLVTEETVLRLEGNRMIILSEEETTLSSGCSGENFKERLIYYVDLPKVADFIGDLQKDDQNLTDLIIQGSHVSFVLNSTQDNDSFTVKYDMGLPLFQNLVSIDSEGSKTQSVAEQDRDLGSIDLSNILFCENNDDDTSDCVQGNYSDILF